MACPTEATRQPWNDRPHKQVAWGPGLYPSLARAMFLRIRWPILLKSCSGGVWRLSQFTGDWDFMNKRLAGGLAAGLLGMLAPLAIQAQTQTVTLYGSLSNFDVINDTGETAHGFEIEIH